MPATSQLDKLISITAISVLSCFKTIRDWFRSFGFCIGGLHRVTSATMCAISSPPPHSISKKPPCRPTRQGYRGRLIWLGARQTQQAVRDLEIGQPINSENCSETAEGVARESEGRSRVSLLRAVRQDQP